MSRAGIAVDRRQRLVVHLDRDHRLARRVHDPGRRHPGGPAVDRAADELRGRRLDAGDVEHLAQPDAGPLGVADEVAADLVADAGDGHVLLEHRQGDELAPGQRRLAVDQAVDPQRPVRGVDARGQQRGVDPVEAVVGHHDRGQPGRPSVDEVLRRAPRPGTVTDAGGIAGRRPDRRRPLAVEQRATDDARRPRRPRSTPPARMRNERRDQSGIVRVGTSDRRRAAGPSPDRSEQPAEDPDADADRDRRRRPRRSPATTAGRRARRGSRRRRTATKPIDGEAASRRAGEDPEAGPDGERDDDDEQLEGELVVGPEQADDEVLGARRLEVDDDLADRRRRASVAPGEQAGEQLGDAERGGGRDDPGDGGRPVASARGSVGGRSRSRRACSAAYHRARCDVRVSRPDAGAHATARPAARRRSAARRRGSGRRGAGRPRSGRRPRRGPPASTSAWVNPGGISSTWCETRTIAAGRACRGQPGEVARCSVSRAPRSRLAAGSSRSSRSGSGIRARAIEVRRRSPADSVP